MFGPKAATVLCTHLVVQQQQRGVVGRYAVALDLLRRPARDASLLRQRAGGEHRSHEQQRDSEGRERHVVFILLGKLMGRERTRAK